MTLCVPGCRLVWTDVSPDTVPRPCPTARAAVRADASHGRWGRCGASFSLGGGPECDHMQQRPQRRTAEPGSLREVSSAAGRPHLSPSGPLPRSWACRLAALGQQCCRCAPSVARHVTWGAPGPSTVSLAEDQGWGPSREEPQASVVTGLSPVTGLTHCCHRTVPSGADFVTQELSPEFWGDGVPAVLES